MKAIFEGVLLTCNLQKIHRFTDADDYDLSMLIVANTGGNRGLHKTLSRRKIKLNTSSSLSGE